MPTEALEPMVRSVRQECSFVLDVSHLALSGTCRNCLAKADGIVNAVSPLLDLKGAVAAQDDSPDGGVAWHYGDPFAEQRTAVRSVAVVDRSHRGRARGARRRPAGLVALADLAALRRARARRRHRGAGAGRARARRGPRRGRARGRRRSGWTRSATAPTPLLSYLDSMRFWSKVEPRDATAERAVLTVLGPDAPALLAGLGLPTPAEPTRWSSSTAGSRGGCRGPAATPSTW